MSESSFGVSLVDTHCHLNYPDFDLDCDEAINRAREAGVERIVVVGYDLASSRHAINIARAHENIRAAVGIHPEAAHEWTPDARDELTALATHAGPLVVAWGEVGLDYHWESFARDQQRRVFSEQISVANALNLPLSVHCRDAYGDVIDTLITHPGARAVLHCFTGSPEEAERAILAGYYLGVGGIATFKKNDALREIIRRIPIDRILLETDSPYLAPQARRGKRNEPAFTALVAETIAPVVGLTMHEFARVTSENAARLFGPGIAFA